MNKKIRLWSWLAPIFIFVFFSTEALATDWYAAPNGASSNNGTIGSAWDLQTALNGAAGKIKAGDTLLLRGGVYTGLFQSNLSGTASQLITVRSYLNEWAIIDGAPFVNDTDVTLQVNGSNTIYRDFEVTNTNTDRPVQFPYRPATVNVYGASTKFINLLVHDGGQGFGFWTPAQNSEIYGCIIYNNGGEDRDHGIYTQNDSTSKIIRDNIIFNSYGYGIHAYGSGTLPLANYTFQGNIFVNDSVLIGNRPVQNLVFRDNNQYGGRTDIGYTSSSNNQALVENNWFASELVRFGGWKNAQVKNNKFWKVYDPVGGLVNLTYYQGYSTTDYTFSGNTHYQFDPHEYNDYYVAFPTGAYGYKFNNTLGGPPADGFWQNDLGYDLDGTYVVSSTARPSGTEIFIRPNLYDPERATIVIYNWNKLAAVNLNLTGVAQLQVGDKYQIRNALNYKTQSVVGSFTGTPVSLSMNTWSVVTPIGSVPELSDRPSPFPDFGVFVISKVKDAVAPGAPSSFRVQ